MSAQAVPRFSGWERFSGGQVLEWCRHIITAELTASAPLGSFLCAALTHPGKLLAMHPHMLRHACGYALANKGHDTLALQAYLGHKNIQHTVRYTEMAPTRFKDFWR